MAKKTKPSVAVRRLNEADLKRWISAETLACGRRFGGDAKTIQQGEPCLKAHP